MHSKHFSEKELSCKCCGLNNVTPELLELAEVCRAILDVPMIVHCASRCPKHNAEVGGVENSTHIQGKAMDFHAKGLSHSAVYKVLRDWHSMGRLPLLGGIGLYDWGVHIDTGKATDGHLRTWDGRSGRK